MTYTLGHFTHTTTENACLQPDATKLLIQKSDTSRNEAVDLAICTKLAKWLHVDVFLVCTCVSQTVEIIDAIFKSQGIPELEPENNSTDRSHSQGFDGGSDSKSYASTAPLYASKMNKTVGTDTKGQAPPAATLDSLNNIHPQKYKNQAIEAVTSSLDPSARDPQNDFNPNGKAVGVVTGNRESPPVTYDPEYDNIRQGTTHTTDVVVPINQYPIPRIPEPRFDRQLQGETDQTLGTITKDRDPPPIIHNHHNLSPRNKAVRVAEMVTESQHPTSVAYNLQRDRDEVDRIDREITSSQNSTHTIYDLQYDSSPQWNIVHSSASTAQSETLIAQPPYEFPHPLHNMDSTGTSFAYPAGPSNRDTSYLANRPEILSHTGGDYAGDALGHATEQQISDGIAGELFVSSAAVPLFQLI